MATQRVVLILILTFILLYEMAPNLFRQRWTLKQPLINAIQFGLNNRAQFIQMTCFDVPVFLSHIVNPLRNILRKPTSYIGAWLNDGLNVHHLSLQLRRQTHSIENRAMRFLMLNRSYPIPALEHLFGQRRSTIYEDAWLLAKCIAKLTSNGFHLPHANTPEYNSLLGVGVLNNFCSNRIPYIMDGHEVPIQKPAQQRLYYDGRKKKHVCNFLMLHDGNGVCRYVHGAIQGSHNDITLLRDSDFFTNLDFVIDFNHFILCDGAWRYEGAPFLCSYTDRTFYTVLETVFNFLHAEARVICENYYGRLHLLFPILDYWTLRLDKLNVWIRALCYLTNVHITHQSPLR